MNKNISIHSILNKCDSTYHGEYLNLALFPSWELVKRKLQSFSLDPKTRRQCMCRSHPDVRVRRVADTRADRNALQLSRQEIEHGLSVHKRRRPKRYGELIARTVIITTHLRLALRDLNTIQCRNLGRREVIQCSIDVPAIEARVSSLLIFGRYARLVEGRVRRVLEHRLGETLVVVDRAVADKLDLRHTGDGLEVWVEDRLFLRASFVIAVPIALAGRVKCLEEEFEYVLRMSLRCLSLYLRKRILLFRREVGVPEQKSTVLYTS